MLDAINLFLKPYVFVQHFKQHVAVSNGYHNDINNTQYMF